MSTLTVQTHAITTSSTGLPLKELPIRTALHEEMKVDDHIYGQVTATPLPSRQYFFDHLSSHSEQNPSRETARQAALRVLNRTQDWMQAQGPRAMLKATGGPSHQYAFVEIPNCYRHEVNVTASPYGNESYTWLRVPVMSDYRNGSITLPDINRCATHPEFHERMQKSLIATYQTFLRSKLLTSAQKQGLEFTKEILAHPAASYENRRYLLEQQMLYYIEHQLQNNPQAYEQHSLTVVHMSLLDPSLHLFGLSGWMHSEGKEMEEMKYLFDVCRGKQIIFDAPTTAFIDDQWNVHLPIRNNQKPITLDTHFMNISVQNHTNEAVRTQNESNSATMERLTQIVNSKKIDANVLISNLQQQFRRSQKLSKDEEKQLYQAYQTSIACDYFNRSSLRLVEGHSTYARAFEIGAALALLHIPFSTGCQSAKDRTGLTCGGISAHLVRSSLEAQQRINTLLHKDCRPLEKQLQQITKLYELAISPGSLNHTIGQINGNWGFLLVNPIALARTRFTSKTAAIRQTGIAALGLLKRGYQALCSLAGNTQ
jgi:hypothetical protein